MAAPIRLARGAKCTKDAAVARCGGSAHLHLRRCSCSAVADRAGGVIRVVLAGAPSILLRRELYITPAIVSAAVFVALRPLGMDGISASGIAVALGFIACANYHCPAGA